MPFTLVNILLTLGLMAAMIGLVEVGRFIGIWKANRTGEPGTSLVTVESAVFGLVGLILGFTFASALTGFETERRSIGQEANAINTAWERLDLLRAEERHALQKLMLQYIDSRLKEFQKQRNDTAAESEFIRALDLQDRIWEGALAGCQSSGLPQSFTLLLPAVNQMADISRTRHLAVQIHPPIIIPGMLAMLMLVCSLLAGYSMAGKKSRSWLHIICFLVSIALTVFVITDLEFPYLGLFRVGNVDYHDMLEIRDRFSHQFSLEETQHSMESPKLAPRAG